MSLAVVSFVSRPQLKDEWFSKFQHFVDKCNITGEICAFKNSDDVSPILHLNLGVRKYSKRFWRDRERLQSSFRSLIATGTEPMTFHPFSYGIIDNRLCLQGVVSPNIICGLHQHKLSTSVSKKCKISLMSLDLDKHRYIRKSLKTLPLPEPFVLDNISMVVKNGQIKINNSIVIDWIDLDFLEKSVSKNGGFTTPSNIDRRSALPP